MKVIIAGSRGITLFQHVSAAYIHSGFQATELVSGMCPNSPDMLAFDLATVLGLPRPTEFPAIWRDRDGIKDPTAGFARNVKMGRYVQPDGGLIAVWDGDSNGTAHMIKTARRFKLRVYVHKVPHDYQPL